MTASGLFLAGELGGSLRCTLQGSAPPRGICESSRKFSGSRAWLFLLQQKVTELFAGGNNWPWRHRKFFDPIFGIGGLSHQGNSLVRFTVCLGRPCRYLERQNCCLGGPIIIA